MLGATGGRGYSSSPPGRKSLFDILSAFLTLVTILVIGYFVLHILGIWGGSTKNPTNTANPTPSTPPAFDPLDGGHAKTHSPAGTASSPAFSTDVRQASERGTEQQALAFAKTRQSLALARAEDVSRLADECLTEIAAFESLVRGLLTDDEGKKVAGDSVQLGRFRAVYEKDRPQSDVVERVRRAASDLVAPVRASHANPKDGSNPGDALMGELDRLATQLAGVKRIWAQDRRTVDAIVTDAKRGPRPASTETLDRAVRAEAEAEALALAVATEKERARVREEMKAKQVKEAGELERQIEEAKLEKLRSAKAAEAGLIKTDADLTAQKGKDAIADEKAKAERERKLKKANSSEVKELLAPLLTPGYHQPYKGGGGAIGVERVAQKGPISLRKLEAIGALEKTMPGLYNLSCVTGDPVDDVRPRLKLPGYTGWWSTAQQEKIQKVQDLLNELGSVMVEEGMLAK